MTSIDGRPGPLAERDEAPQPWRRRDGVVKFLEFPVRKPGMTHRAFHLYWQRHHSPHVMNVTGFSRHMRKYVSAHGYDGPVSGLPQRYRQDAPFDGASEVWINGLEEVSSWLGHPQYAELIQPDEARFLCQSGRGRVLLVREETVLDVMQDAPESGLVRVYLQLEARPGVARDTVHAACSAFARTLATGSLNERPRQVLVNHRIEEPLPIELPAPGVDVVLALGFTRQDHATSFLAHPDIESGWAGLREIVTDVDAIPALMARVCVVYDEFSFQATMTQPKSFSWHDTPVE
jgi:hypothetical protein